MVNLNIPHDYREIDGKTLQLSKEQFTQMKDWLIDPRGSCLFYGEPGRGKTAMCIYFMRFLEKIKKIPYSNQKFVKISDFNQWWLTNSFGSYENYEALKKLQECHVLCLDDIGAKKLSDGFLDYVYTLIDYRSERKELISFYTTNLNSKEASDILGPRIISRISGGLTLEIKGKDWRKNSK